MKHNWENIKIGAIATQKKRLTKVDAKSKYNLIGIRSNNEGVFFRETKSGNDIFSENLYQVKEGDFIYSRLSAPSGGFAVVTKEFDNCFVSNEFPVFEIDEEKSSSKFLFYHFCQKSVLHQLQSKGTGRTRFSEADFFNQEIVLPPLEVQQTILATLENVKTKIDEIKQLRQEQSKDIKNLLFSKYTELIETAKWLPMKEVAPIVRRPVAIKEEELYPELGIRCFGNGTFHKPALTGLEVGTKKIFQIKKGDLVFSNVFAWEGGIAVAKEDDNNRYGSHRFISCLAKEETVLAEYLCYHFLSQKGLEDINACSPGGAGRNKTLGLDKLMKIPVPVPTLEQQKEFVALLEKTNAIKEEHNQTEQELNELMPSLLDKAFKGELFANVSVQPKTAKVIALPQLQEQEEKHFLKRKVLATYIINQSLNDAKFGDVKFEKLLHLSDYFALKRNLGQNYFQQAAGPYDNAFTHAYFKQVLNAKWFNRSKKGNQFVFSAGQNQNKSTNTYGFFSDEELNRVNEIINYFKSSDYEQPEIISTLYAVWNNRIIRRQEITDELLTEDFFNWDKQKLKYKDRIKPALQWMRNENFVPDGWGKVIEKVRTRKK